MLSTWISTLFRQRSACFRKTSHPQRCTPRLEELETRLVPAATTNAIIFGGPRTFQSASPIGLTPAQIQAAYGINNIKLRNAVVGDGSGQTIAIVDPMDNPSLVSSSAANWATSDLHEFDVQFGLPDPPNFTKIMEPGTKPAGVGNGVEQVLDVEWAHVIAPKANIILVESINFSTAAEPNDIYSYGVATAVNPATTTALGLPAVSAVSMSFGDPLDTPTDPAIDNLVFSNHTAGITFLAATGDNGAEVNYPADSPYVVAVGGTTLTPNGASPRGFTEAGWGDGLSAAAGSSGGSGGGIDVGGYAEPAYQQQLISTSKYGGERTVPDVSFNAGTGVAVYDSYDFGALTPWDSIGGTSLSAPCWAGLIAIANQGRALDNLPNLSGYNDVLPKLYQLANEQYHQNGQKDFYDITSGNNGFAAGVGYDLNTGIGTPVANLLVPDLVSAPVTHFLVTAVPTSQVAGSPIQITVTALNVANAIVPTYIGTVHFSCTDLGAVLPMNYTFTGSGASFDNGVHVFTVTLHKAGMQTITVADFNHKNLSGSAPVTIAPAAASHFVVTSSQSGSNAVLVVKVLDQFNNPVPTFTGTVTFSSSSLSSLPASYTFTGAGTGLDNGIHRFVIPLPTSYGIFDLEILSSGLTTYTTKVVHLYGLRVTS